MLETTCQGDPNYMRTIKLTSQHPK